METIKTNLSKIKSEIMEHIIAHTETAGFINPEYDVEEALKQVDELLQYYNLGVSYGIIDSELEIEIDCRTMIVYLEQVIKNNNL